MKDIDETEVSRFYQPYSWLPHITIGKKLDKNQMVTAVMALQECFAPIEARVVRLGLAKVNPHEDVSTIQLR